MKERGHGAIANKVLGRLLDALAENYPNIAIGNDDFWFQNGDYRKSTWDLVAWGASIPYRAESGANLKVSLHSWDTMKSCAKGLTLISHRSNLPNEFEVCAHDDP